MVATSSQGLTKSLLAAISLFIFQPLLAQQAQIELNQNIVNASNSFLSSLGSSQREKASFEFDDEERLNWHFIPRTRQGIALKELDASQLKSAQFLLQTLLSAKGYQKAENVRSLENVLAVLEPNGPFVRDPDLYYISVFGVPAMPGAWGIRYEGHHLAFNWTFIAGAGVASSPQFFGSNPAEVRTGVSAGTRVLAVEEDLSRTLVQSLSQSQLDLTVLQGDAPRDIFTAAEKEVRPLENLGILYGQLNPEQREILMAIITEVASAQADGISDERIQKIRDDGIEDIKFAWMGSTERGGAHYYRVQGASFLIEYDNTQNNANHIHLVWRDFDGDFGRDLIRLHYDAVATEYGSGHSH